MITMSTVGSEMRDQVAAGLVEYISVRSEVNDIRYAAQRSVSNQMATDPGGL
jgi:hypothetical protein